MRPSSRRQVLATGVGFLGTSLAGCIGREATDQEPSSSPTAQASFFVFGDIADHVAGEAAVAETVVPAGQHGHGWEPGPRVRETILEADLFLYGLPGFQPWADDTVRDLETDGHGTSIVEVAAGIELVDHESHDDGHETDGDPDGDPHFWLDPVRMERAVENVREGFVTVDPDAADAYDRATDAYLAELDDLHARFGAVVDDRTRDVILVAGHDAFVYLRDRYDVRVEALTGLAPDDQPSPRDIERAQDLIADHGIEYLCADPLESQRAAEQLVAETDAREVLPLTAIPGQTRAWREREWGYRAIMAHVNLPTLERALGAE